MITGTYILQVNRASFNQNQISSTCLLCKKEDETTEHFLLHCELLENIRKPIMDDILKIYKGLDQDDSSHLLQCVLDHTVTFPELRILERHTRRLCHALHIERFKQLPQTVTKRKRNKDKRKLQCKPAGTV